MLSVTEIKRFIDDDISSEKKRLAAEGQRYREGKHDILKYRLFYYNTDGKLVEDTMRANIKIPHPFFFELSEQLAPYMLSFKENPIRAKDNAEGLQDYLDLYFDDDFWAEIGDLITGAHDKGFEYLYAYKNDENRLVFQCADSMGVIEVRAKDADDGQDHVIYWYVDRIEKGKKAVKRIQDWDSKETRSYVQYDNGKIEPDKDVQYNPRPHVVFTDPATGQKMGRPLGFVPFWRLDNNKKQRSWLEPIKRLIDDYDLHACSLSNNLKDFDTPLYAISGFEGDNLDELQVNVKTKKIIGVGEGGDVDIKTVDIPYEARKAKLEIDEKAIYKFGMGLNTQGLKDTTATTNIAIKTAYASLKMKGDGMEKRLRKFLKEIIKVVLAEINEEHGKDYQISDIKFDFTRETMVNETENIQNAKVEAETRQIEVNTVLNVAVQIGDEKALQAICDIMEWDFDELQSQVERLREEQNTIDARKTLGGVVTDESAAEIGSGTIPE